MGEFSLFTSGKLCHCGQFLRVAVNFLLEVVPFRCIYQYGQLFHEMMRRSVADSLHEVIPIRPIAS